MTTNILKQLGFFSVISCNFILNMFSIENFMDKKHQISGAGVSGRRHPTAGGKWGHQIPTINL